ncbi:unnamed protein product [Cunninghamella echinulata]
MCYLSFGHFCGSECPVIGTCKDSIGFLRNVCSCHQPPPPPNNVPNLCQHIQKCSW